MKEPKLIERMGRSDDKVSTRLLDKNYSPLIVRKYMLEGWPCFVSIICDQSLSDLDKVVWEAFDKCKNGGMVQNDLQSLRNITGFLSEEILNYYNSVKKGSVEGVAVLWYIDKAFISSLWGDFMVHASCKQELFGIIQTLPHV